MPQQYILHLLKYWTYADYLIADQLVSAESQCNFGSRFVL